jgi:hypothetical protein
MSQNLITLNDIFNAENNKEAASNFSKVESTEKLTKLKDDQQIFIKGIEWKILRKEILKKLIDLLDIEVVKIIVKSWIDNDFFQQINQIKDAQPNETIIIPLAQHTITSTHNPYIEIIYNGKVVHTINFEVNVDFHFKAVNLSFQNKKLKEISSGECSINGEFLCEKIKFLEAEIKKVNLPGMLNLGDGISITKN